MNCAAARSVQAEVFAVLAGALAGQALEQAGEVLRILEAQVIGDDADVVGAGGQTVFGHGNHLT